MKKIAMLLLAAMAASVAFGGINVQWNSKQGFQGPNGKFVPQDTESYRFVWDLVYTASDSIGTPTLTATSKDDSDIVSYGSDVVLSRRELLDGAVWTDGKTPVTVTDKLTTDVASSDDLAWSDKAKVSGTKVYSNYSSNFSYTSGGVYMAVFQIMSDGTVNYATSDLLKSGAGLILGRTSPDMTAADSIDFGSAVTSLRYFDTIQTIPEPATMSLLGLGALAMVIRRKLRK